MPRRILFSATFLLILHSIVVALDFSSPEATLANYINALRKGDKSTVAICFQPEAKDFYLPGTSEIGEYKIIQKITYREREIKRWNTKGIKPPTKIGDIELQVEELYYGKKEMFSYVLRKFDTQWKIIAHWAWNTPD